MQLRKALVASALVIAIVTAALGRQQPDNRRKSSQEQPVTQPRTASGTPAELSAMVAKLRAEVELLELEHNLDKALLSEALTEQRKAESDTGVPPKMLDEIQSLMSNGPTTKTLDALDTKFADLEALDARAETERKALVELSRAKRTVKKKAFMKQTIELNEKRLALAELEKQLANAN